MTLGERIALARKQAGLSQEQLGEQLGVSRQAVSKWESGQTNPDVAYIAELCRLFGVSSDWLLLGREERQAGQQAPRISEAELQRTADRVYRMIEDRIRRERRRLGL